MPNAEPARRNADLERVFSAIDPEAIAADTLEFVKVKSETGREGDGSEFLAELMRREGVEPAMDEVEPKRPNVYARIQGSGTGAPRTLAFNGHTDTIPIGKSDPPSREGDWVIGRGAEDMKGGLVAMVHAASALRKAGARLVGDLWLTGVIGHEAPEGKKEGPNRLIERLNSGDVKADAIVIVEGPCAIWAASLGSAIFTISITDDRGPIHTIKIPYSENPARWVGELLLEFERMEERFRAGPAHPLCGRQLLNVGIVHGGDYMNRLPTPFRISGTRRWAPGLTVEDIQKEFDELCDQFSRRSGLKWSCTLEGDREPFETPAGHPIVRSLQRAGQAVSGRAPEIIGMGLVGDANLYVNGAQAPTVYYGPAHETAHSDHERVSVSQLVHCAKVYAAATLDFCGVGA